MFRENIVRFGSVLRLNWVSGRGVVGVMRVSAERRCGRI